MSFIVCLTHNLYILDINIYIFIQRHTIVEDTDTSVFDTKQIENYQNENSKMILPQQNLIVSVKLFSVNTNNTLHIYRIDASVYLFGDIGFLRKEKNIYKKPKEDKLFFADQRRRENSRLSI